MNETLSTVIYSTLSNTDTNQGCESGDCGSCDYCFEVMEAMGWACMEGCCACCGCTCWDTGNDDSLTK